MLPLTKGHLSNKDSITWQKGCPYCNVMVLIYCSRFLPIYEITYELDARYLTDFAVILESTLENRDFWQFYIPSDMCTWCNMFILQL